VLTIPAGTVAGTYFLLARADGDDALAETNEGNNVYGVYVTIGADLVVTNVVAPADAGAGLAFTITDTTRNQGGSGARVGHDVLPLDQQRRARRGRHGARQPPRFRRWPAGASDTGSVTVTIPAGTPVGTHYLFAKADGGNPWARLRRPTTPMRARCASGPTCRCPL
jgi:hypothetical protein